MKRLVKSRLAKRVKSSLFWLLGHVMSVSLVKGFSFESNDIEHLLLEHLQTLSQISVLSHQFVLQIFVASSNEISELSV